MPPFDLLQTAGELLVIVCELRRPWLAVVYSSKIAPGVGAIAGVDALGGSQGRVPGRLRQAVGRVFGWIEQAVFGGLVQLGAGQLRDLLEGLHVPVFHSLDRGHLVQAIWKLAEFFDAVGEADRELFG